MRESTINAIKPIQLDYKLEQRLYQNAVYIPRTGCVEWHGKPSAAGYAVISVKNVPLYVHRLMYALATGQIFIKELDHICRNTICIAPYHLRELSHKQNTQRRKAVSSIKGVYKYKNRAKPFFAYIKVNRKRINLGYFSTKEEAAIAYNEAALKYHFEPSLNKIGENNG